MCGPRKTILLTAALLAWIELGSTARALAKDSPFDLPELGLCQAAVQFPGVSLPGVQIRKEWEVFASHFKGGDLKTRLEAAREHLTSVTQVYSDIDWTRGSFDPIQLMLRETGIEQALVAKDTHAITAEIKALNGMFERLAEEKIGLSLPVVNRLIDLSTLVKNYPVKNDPELKTAVREWRQRLFDAKAYNEVLILSQLLSQNSMMQTAGKVRMGALVADPVAFNRIHQVWFLALEVLSESQSFMDQALFGELTARAEEAFHIHEKNNWKGVTPQARRALENLMETGGERELHQWIETLASNSEIPKAVTAEIQEKVVVFGRKALSEKDWLKNPENAKLLLTKFGAKNYNRVIDQSLSQQYEISVNSEKSESFHSYGLLISGLEAKEGARKLFVARLFATLRYRMDSILARVDVGDESAEAKKRLETYFSEPVRGSRD